MVSINLWGLVIFSIITYTLGAIPFSLIITKLKGIDLRQVGSGNLGATNVYRAAGLPTAILVFLLDGLKGYIPTYFALQYDQFYVHILVGALAIVGHTLSPFVKFKGGKGAATGLGVLLAISPDVFAVLFSVAMVLILITRYVAPTTILCCILAPVLLYFFAYPFEYISFVSIICIYVIYRHKANIKRILEGKENKI